jgi:hypothetical protein
VDTGLSRTSAGAIAIGNGTQGDFSGSIKAGGITITTAGALTSLFQSTGNASTLQIDSVAAQQCEVLFTKATSNEWAIYMPSNSTDLRFYDYNHAGDRVTISSGNGLVVSGYVNASSGFQVNGAATTGNVLLGNGTYFVSSNVVRSFNYVIDGSGSVPATGSWGQISVPLACTMTGWVITADQASGLGGVNTVVDVLRSTYAGFPGSLASIMGGDKITLYPNEQKNESVSPGSPPTSSFTPVSLSAGDILQFNLNSVNACTRLNVTLLITIP